MKTRIFFLSILFVTAYVFSQDEIGLPKLKPSNDYWSIGYYASGLMGIVNGYANDELGQPGYGGIIELTYNDSKRDLLLIAGFYKINTTPENEYFEVTEFSIGPRFSVSENKTAFIEFTIGGLMTSEIRRNYYWPDYNYHYYQKLDPRFNIAASAGFGGKIQLSQNSDFIYKLRLFGSIVSFVSVNTGVSFNTKKNKTSIKSISKSYFGASLLGGFNKSSFKGGRVYGLGVSYGLELTYKSSPKIEIFLDANSNRLKSENNDYNEKFVYASVTAGGRFYINESKATAFIECGGGFYAFNIYGGYSDFNKDYPGFIVGTGTKFNIYRFVDIIAKGNLHFPFTERIDIAPDFLTVQGGIRFNL
jgi:hypothetical protein